jgi:hypothetical protein
VLITRVERTSSLLRMSYERLQAAKADVQGRAVENVSEYWQNDVHQSGPVRADEYAVRSDLKERVHVGSSLAPPPPKWLENTITLDVVFCATSSSTSTSRRNSMW